MRALEVSTASDCPMRCGYCPQKTVVAAYGESPRLMTMETLQRAVRNSGTREVIFAGFAEPYLNPLCTDMIEWAAQEHTVVLYTTLVGMTVADVARLAALSLASLTIHLPDANGVMTWSPTDAYRAVLAAMLNHPGHLRFMAMGPVHPSLVDILRDRFVGGTETMHSRAGNVDARMGFATIRKRGALACRAARELDRPVLLPDGRLVLCCMDWGLKHVLGNLAEQTWDEIYAGAAFRDLQAAMGAEDGAKGECLCRGCEYAEAAR